jgi:hypothetical protein
LPLRGSTRTTAWESSKLLLAYSKDSFFLLFISTLDGDIYFKGDESISTVVGNTVDLNFL